MPDRELDITALAEAILVPGGETDELIEAVDAASHRYVTTWLTVNGRRIAKIAPVDESTDAAGAVVSFTRLPRELRGAAVRGRLGHST